MALLAFFLILGRQGKNLEGGGNHHPFVRRGFKAQNVYITDHTILFKFHQPVHLNTFQIMYGETSNVSICNGITKNLNGKFTAKIDFPIERFMSPLLMLIMLHDFRNLKPLHT